MTPEVDLLRQSGALLEGHFLLTSGLHSPSYIEKFRILERPQHTEQLCAQIARRYRDAGIQVVVGPTTGGIIIAYEVARQLGVRGIFAEREGEQRILRRGFQIAPGERALVVDDILTTGGSIREVIVEVRRHGGQVAGVGVLVNRANPEVDFGVPSFACYRLPMIAYAPQDCPLCRSGVPLVKPGTSPREVER